MTNHKSGVMVVRNMIQTLARAGLPKYSRLIRGAPETPWVINRVVRMVKRFNLLRGVWGDTGVV